MKYSKYKEELLSWEYEQIKLRKKYSGTPAGFQSETDYELACEQWNISKKEFDNSKEKKLCEGIFPEKQPFVGRSDIFSQIDSSFSQGSNNIILYGIRGMGKRSIALEYMHRAKAEYDHILYVAVDTTIQNAFVDDNKIRFLNLQYSREEFGNRRQYFLNKLDLLRSNAQKYKILLIITNVNSFEDADFMQLLDIPCQKIIVSELNLDNSVITKSAKNTTNIYVSALPPDNIKDLIDIIDTENKLTETDKNHIFSYASKTGYHTLSIIFEINRRLHKIETPDTKTFFKSVPLKKIHKEILMDLSILPASGIDRDLFQLITDTKDVDLDYLLKYLLVMECINETTNKKLLFIHPAIAEEVVSALHPSVNNCSRFIRGWGDYLDGTTTGVMTWDRDYEENLKLEEYVLALTDYFKDPAAWLGKAFEEFVTFLWVQQYFDEANAYALKLYNTIAKYYGEESTMAGREALRVAAVYYNSADFSNADMWYEKAYKLLKATPSNEPEKHLQLMIAISKLCRSSYDNKDYSKGLIFCDEARQIYDDLSQRNDISSKDKDRSDIIYGYVLLEKAKIYLALGNANEAENKYNLITSQLTSIDKNCFRQKEFLIFYCDLLITKNNLMKAKQIAEELYELTVRYRGDANTTSLTFQEKLADIYVMCNENDKAKKLYETLLILIKEHYDYQKSWIIRIKQKLKVYK